MKKNNLAVLHVMKPAAICAVVGLLGVSAGRTALVTFDSTGPANNAATRTDWLNAIGIAGPQHLVDFELGFTDGQNIHNAVIGPWLTISYGGTGGVMVESGAGSISGSNPVGSFAAEFGTEGNGSSLSFSTPVDYLSFYDIDKGSATITVYFQGGASTTASIAGTGASGNSAEFYGIYRNDQPRITGITFSSFSGGAGTWGMDNIEYGIVPEPASAAAATACVICFVAAVWRRRRT